MAKTQKPPKLDLVERIIQQNFLFRGLEAEWLVEYLPPDTLSIEKFFSNRPIYTAFVPDRDLDTLYVMLDEGIVITCQFPF